jgi:histidyl-tRNA synthetase
MAKKNQSVQAIRGMHDILPDQTPRWQYAEKIIREVLASYCYQEIRLPLVEKTELFKRSIGEVTDIVEKEMYTFNDRNNDSLTLRPEGTAGCLRACLEHGLLHNQVHRLWYCGPMFRHERPQKGRYRQFYQLGLETYGMPGPDIDAEIILLTDRMWTQLGVRDKVRLELNTLGTTEERLVYRERLVDYFKQHIELLDEDSLRRLETNPLRILDSKNRDMKQLIQNAPELMEYMGEDSRSHFETLTQTLDSLGINYALNTRLVRGLDYYGKTVFEWVTDDLGAQGTNYAIGFAMGMERLLLLMEQLDNVPVEHSVDVYMIRVGVEAEKEGMRLAEKIRDQVDGIKLQINCGGGSFKSQFKKADKSGAEYAIIIGDDEVSRGEVSLKPLRTDQEQKNMTQNEAIQLFLGMK